MRNSVGVSRLIRIHATADGSYTVYRDGKAMVTGLTRDQAYAVAQSLNVVVVDRASPDGRK